MPSFKFPRSNVWIRPPHYSKEKLYNSSIMTEGKKAGIRQKIPSNQAKHSFSSTSEAEIPEQNLTMTS